MKEVTDKLAANSAPISEKDQVMTLLGSLLCSYSTLLTALEDRHPIESCSTGPHPRGTKATDTVTIIKYLNICMEVNQLQHCLEDREKQKLTK